MASISKHKHFKSKTHSWCENSFTRRYSFLIPNFCKVDETMRKHVNSYNEKFEEYEFRCLLKLLTDTNRVRYFGFNPQSSLHYSFYVPKNFLSSILYSNNIRNIKNNYTLC